MALLTLQRIKTGTSNINHVAADALNDTFTYVPKIFYSIKNGSGSSITVTFSANQQSLETENLAGQLAIPDLVETVVAGGENMIGIPTAYVVSGVITAQYSDVTSVTVAPCYVRL